MTLPDKELTSTVGKQNGLVCNSFANICCISSSGRLKLFCLQLVSYSYPVAMATCIAN